MKNIKTFSEFSMLREAVALNEGIESSFDWGTILLSAKNSIVKDGRDVICNVRMIFNDIETFHNFNEEDGGGEDNMIEDIKDWAGDEGIIPKRGRQFSVGVEEGSEHIKGKIVYCKLHFYSE